MYLIITLLNFKIKITQKLLLLQISLSMQIALKKQAETYFQSIPDIQQKHNGLKKGKELQQFYTLLICKFLPTNQLTSKIKNLHQAKKIQWSEFIDALWGLALAFAQSNSSLTLLGQFIASIDSLNIVERKILLKLLPQNLIELAGLETKKVLEKKFQRAHRKFYFDQKKHNLMRQNNEGYARLTLLLATIGQDHSYQVTWKKLISILGNFDLDPDRVLDLLIESYLQSTNSQICLSIIKNFNPQSTAVLLGNKILTNTPAHLSQRLIFLGKVQNFITGTREELYKQKQNMVNPKLVDLICHLISQNFLKFQQILPYLGPQDSLLDSVQIKRIQFGKQKIFKSFRLEMNEKTVQQLAKIKEEEDLKILGQLIYSSKLAIIDGFLHINDWANFGKYWAGMRGRVDLVVYQPLLRTLLNMLEWVIDPLYSKISYRNYFKTNFQLKINFPILYQSMTQCMSLSDSQLQKIFTLFQQLHIYIGFHSPLFIKICRLFTSILTQPQLFASQSQPASSMPSQLPQSSLEPLSSPLSACSKQKIQKIIKLYLLPGSSLQTGNPAISKELYRLLETFDYRFRFRCYLYHYRDGMTTNPLLARIFLKTRDKQTIVVNNLSDKNKKIFMKKIAKLTHNQALQTFYWIFRRILMDDYEKVVPEIVAVLSNSCSLSLQISIFVALHHLSEQQTPAMNFKTGQQQPWFKNIINYISLFYRKYLEIDIQPIFDYIIMKIGLDVRQLEEKQQLPGGLLSLLHQILSKMFCNFVLKQVNKNKLQMLCAGLHLQLQAMDISSQIKASRKSKLILQKFFWGKSVDQYDGQSLAISLLVLLTQKRSQLLHKSTISSTKIIGDIYDDYTTLIIQLIRVLNQLSTQYTHYAKLLPQNSLNLLINEYKLPIEIAFEIYRPSVKHISTMGGEEWGNFVQTVGGVMKRYVNTEEKYIGTAGEFAKIREYLNENYGKIFAIVSEEFFTAFWMLTLDSIYFPAKLYSEKIQQVKKKAQSRNVRGLKTQKSNDREVEKAKALLVTLKNQQTLQSKKVQDTMNEGNLSRFKIQYLRTPSTAMKDQKRDQKKQDKIASLAIQQFAQIFVQICLLPRMMLDPEQALYCMKITVEIIKYNKLSSGKSIKLLIFIIEHVMSYLPFATERQASYCLAIFLSEILNVLANWNQPNKLKQDLKKWLGIDQSFVQSSYPRLKKHFIRLYVRFGNIVKSIKDEPYNIKNCLYLLQKVDFIPAYKKQAQDLEIYLKQLKQKYSQALITIIEMQLSIIGQKKKNLPVIEQDGQSTVRNQFPTFSNLANVEVAKVQNSSPVRSPINNNKDSNNNGNSNANNGNNASQTPKSMPNDKNQKKDKDSRMDIQINTDRLREKESQSDRLRLKQSVSQRSLQRQREANKNVKPSQTPINVSSFGNSNRQIGKQVQVNFIQNKKQQKIVPQLFTAPTSNPNLSSSMQPQKIVFSGIKTVAQKRAELQKQKQSQVSSVPAPSAQRIKMVKQRRDQQVRKVPSLSQQSIETQNKQIQPQPLQNEKLKKQIKKDQAQPRDQKVQWPNSLQREEKPKPTQIQAVSPVMQLPRKISHQQMKNTMIQQPQMQTLSASVQPTKTVQRLENENYSLIVEIQPPQRKDQDNRFQQYKTKQPRTNKIPDEKTDKQKSKDQNRDKDKDKEKEINVNITRDNREKERRERETREREDKEGNRETERKRNERNERQEKYSQERNQDKQYKRDNRQFQRREKPTESRWKEDLREKDRERERQRQERDKRKDSRDRSSKRKQDRYDKYSKNRKHDHKPKDRSSRER